MVRLMNEWKSVRHFRSNTMKKTRIPYRKRRSKFPTREKKNKYKKKNRNFLALFMALLAAESENCRTARRFSIGPVPDNISFVSVIKLLTENFVNRKFRPVIVLVMIHSHFLSFEPYRPSI